ncbi:hypothetical protein HK096_007184 [Nowakowskiella sp. JEL0078]|nr:hypothetical protein HK096_007184 [Nowakowskiella sp. JEL0078]
MTYFAQFATKTSNFNYRSILAGNFVKHLFKITFNQLHSVLQPCFFSSASSAWNLNRQTGPFHIKKNVETIIVEIKKTSIEIRCFM